MQERKRNSGPRALVLAPTRELAQQIESEINQIVGVCYYIYLFIYFLSFLKG